MGLKDASVFGKKKKTGLPETKLVRTRWSEAALRGETLTEYPRPSMVRLSGKTSRNATSQNATSQNATSQNALSWINLNGFWEYAFRPDDENAWKEPEVYDGKILVPFSPESELSGVRRQLQPDEVLWYRKKIQVPEPSKNSHYLLHFGAVDQSCDVFANGLAIGSHHGGYLPFTLTIPKDVSSSDGSDVSSSDGSDVSSDAGSHAILLTVRVRDVSDTSYHSRGKQKLGRGGMYYTAQSGIWQTVWMEEVPDEYIDSVRIDADPDTGEVKATVKVAEYAETFAGRRVREEIRTIRYEKVHLWSPEDPHLNHLTVKVGNDAVDCYFAFRKFGTMKDSKGIPRFTLNGKICLQTGVLDQGYWCDGLYTAPSDEAMIYDIQTMKDLGFNMIRKHIKIEPDRWYYHCDRLGMIVWQDMVCGGSSYQDWLVTYLTTVLNIRHITIPDGPLSRRLLSRTSKVGRREFLAEVKETIRVLGSHPCIAAWVPFNEGWGQFDAKKVTRLIRNMDPLRIIDSASGWYDQKCGDVVSLHHYFFGLHFKPEKKRVLALTEFGGYTWQVPGHSFSEDLYGYGGYDSKEKLTDAMESLFETEVCGNIEAGLSAFVYTQLSDIEEEANGILTYDRAVIKPDADVIRKLNEKIKTYTI